MGARASGGGRKNKFQWAVDELKQWVATERGYGHTLSKNDLLYGFLDLLHRKSTAVCAERAKKLRTSKMNAESFTEQLMT